MQVSFTLFYFFGESVGFVWLRWVGSGEVWLDKERSWRLDSLLRKVYAWLFIDSFVLLVSWLIDHWVSCIPSWWRKFVQREWMKRNETVPSFRRVKIIKNFLSGVNPIRFFNFHINWVFSIFFPSPKTRKVFLLSLSDDYVHLFYWG